MSRRILPIKPLSQSDDRRTGAVSIGGTRTAGATDPSPSDPQKESVHEARLDFPDAVRPGSLRGDICSSCSWSRYEGRKALDGPVRHVDLRMVVDREERFLHPGARLPAGFRGA